VHGLLYLPFVSRTVGTDSNTYIATAQAMLDGEYTTPLVAGYYYTYPVGFFDLTGIHVTDESVFQAPERQAFRAPGYPAFLALFGGGGEGISRTLALIAQALLFGLGTLLLAFTVRDWWGPGVGLASAGVYALDPFSKHYVTILLSEQLAAVLVLAGVFAYTRAARSRHVTWWAATGVLAASLTLVRAVFVFTVPLVVVAALLQRGTRVRGAAAALGCAAVLLVPWLAWTNHTTGRAVFANWGQGYNLLVAAHGEGFGRTQSEVSEDPAFVRDLELPYQYAPSREQLLRDPEAHPRYLARADTEVRSRAIEVYRERLRDEPMQVLWENVYRAFFLWQAHEDWYQPSGVALAVLRALDVLVLALALVGLVLALRRGGPPRGVALFLIAYTVVIATHHTEARFAMPVRGLYLALMTFGLLALLERLPAWRRRAGTSPARTAPSPDFRPRS
jgi:Dolichyl-phosphate-mannose-protein mannosyltransferase